MAGTVQTTQETGAKPATQVQQFDAIVIGGGVSSRAGYAG